MKTPFSSVLPLAYALYAGLVLFAAFSAWRFGWGGGDTIDEKTGPRSVRDNRGSFRSHYIWSDRYTGGK